MLPSGERAGRISEQVQRYAPAVRRNRPPAARVAKPERQQRRGQMPGPALWVVNVISNQASTSRQGACEACLAYRYRPTARQREWERRAMLNHVGIYHVQSGSARERERAPIRGKRPASWSGEEKRRVLACRKPTGCIVGMESVRSRLSMARGRPSIPPMWGILWREAACQGWDQASMALACTTGYRTIETEGARTSCTVAPGMLVGYPTVLA